MSDHFFHAQIAQLAVPIPTLWSLLVRASARGLWQPSVNSAEVLIGEEATAGCEYALDCDETAPYSMVIEKVLLSREQSSLQTLRHYAKLDCYSDYQLTSLSSNTCQLQIKRVLRQPATAKYSDVDMRQHVDFLQPKQEIDALMKVTRELAERLRAT